MPRGRPKKLPYEDLDSDFKAAIEAATDDDIKKRIAETAMNEVDNQNAKAGDEDLKNQVEAAKLAGEAYREATKANKLRIGYSKFVLESRGKS